MKVIFLGTNGWYDTETGNTISTLIDTKNCYVILDAGNGIHKADKYIKENKPVYLFLSHFHLDHIIGLHILLKFKFSSLKIYGQPGTSKIVKEFIGDLFSVPLDKLPYKTEVIDLNEGWHDSPFKLRCLKLKHVSPCFGYRLEMENKVVSYCTDTGYCDNSVELSRNADLLISECSLAPGQQTPGWPHMNPELAAKLAIESGAKTMALTHFDAEVYTKMGQRKKAEATSKKLFKNSFAAKDGDQIVIK